LNEKIKYVIETEFQSILTDEAYDDLVVYLDKIYKNYSRPSHIVKLIFKIIPSAIKYLMDHTTQSLINLDHELKLSILIIFKKSKKVGCLKLVISQKKKKEKKNIH